MFDDIYAKSSQRKIKMFKTNDGLIDSVRQLLLHNDPYDKAVLNMMLLLRAIKLCVFIFMPFYVPCLCFNVQCLYSLLLKAINLIQFK